MTALPAYFKQYGPVLERAKELDRDGDDPDAGIIALYCRKHVLEQAAKALPAKGTDSYGETMTFFLQLMDDVEAKKSTVTLSPEQAHSACHAYANIAFARAVKAEEGEIAVTGKASKETAMHYYRANVFLTILGQFEGGMDADVNGRRQHAALKASTIMKQAGPSGGNLKPAAPLAAATATTTAATATPLSSDTSAPAPAPAPASASAAQGPVSSASALEAPPPAHTSSVASTTSLPAYTTAPSAAGTTAGFGLELPTPSSPPPSAPLAAPTSQAPGNYTQLGFAESKQLLETCCAQLRANCLDLAQISIDSAAHLRSANSKAKDALELCLFALAAKKRADEPRANKYLVDAMRRLQA